ncbi:MAG: OmpA family protein [Formosimonas sp.]
MKTKQLLKKGLWLTLLVGLSAQAQTQVIKSNWKNGVGVVEFPELSKSYFKVPQIIDLDDLNTVDSGMNKEQVWRLIGRPHFKEGPFGVRVWDYAFRFRQADGSYQVCQYQVHYTKKRPHLVETMYKTCPEAAVPAPVAQVKTLNISADTLFAFDGSKVQDVLPEGMEKIRELGRKITQTYSRVDALQIVGHTDALGSDAYNLALSQARANTVKQLLVNLGIPAAIISTSGMGESSPVVSCAANLPRNAMVACLAPNRRVTVQISGEERVISK